MAENELARPAVAADRAGSDDLAGRLKSAPEVPHLPALRQAARLRLRRQRLVERLHRLGIRSTFEFVDELVRHFPMLSDHIDRRLERYARLKPETLRTVGGDKMPPPPIHTVGGKR